MRQFILPSWARYGLVTLLFIILLMPLWLVKFPPLLDYPNHLARIFVLAHLNDPAFQFSSMYQSNWGLFPYLTMDVSLLAFQKLLPLELAGRILLSLCLVALPLSVWFFLRQANPGSDALAVWSLLLPYNVFFLMGFIDFSLGLSLCFLAVGLWIRYQGRPTVLRWGVLLAVFSATYFTHLFAFGVLALMVTVCSIFKRFSWKRLLLSWVLFLPGSLFYLITRRGVAAPQDIAFDVFGDRWAWVAGFLHLYSSPVDTLTIASLMICLVLALWKNPELRSNPEWVTIGAILFVLFWILPFKVGDAFYIYPRILPALFVVLLSMCHIGKRGRWLAIVAMGIFLLRAGDITLGFWKEQPRLAALAQSFELIPRNARVLPVVEMDNGDVIRRPYSHFWAYGTIRRGWLSPYLFALPGQTPLRLKDDVFDLDGFWDLEYTTPVDWQEVRENYDYVWAYNVPRFAPELEAIGKLILAKDRLQVYQLH
jgi:hypothetical protein